MRSSLEITAGDHHSLRSTLDWTRHSDLALLLLRRQIRLTRLMAREAEDSPAADVAAEAAAEAAAAEAGFLAGATSESLTT